jgi:hypothetical protein
MIVQGQREERARLQASITQLETTLERLRTTSAAGPAAPARTRGLVVAGATSYHKPTCRLAQGRETEPMSKADAAERGLSPCRICKP